MTDQQPTQLDQPPAAGSTADLGELNQRWTEFSQARASLAEVMSDDELRAFGINVEVLDERT